MKSFDLEKALAGEPVKLKNGLKAYVIKKLDSPEIGMHELIGFYETERKRQKSVSRFYDGTRCDDFAITGMWEEPKRYINGIEVPEPVNMDTWEDGAFYWYINFSYADFIDKDVFKKGFDDDELFVEQRLVFETKEGAEAMVKALLNYKVEVKDETI
ncbi:hypothetical protein [Gallibacterium anatis]|uniref:hypothetical protein n=1 Tax=Gallibacterium anatis TaxID=750 RepID=UPI0005322A1E|nr:hypothetical protein [Gallibacterium anatis]KGQ66252.1 hypothetical protein IO49_05865 [Gallibacterium anatis]